MSLILDALSRSRSDASSVPGMDSHHLPGDFTPAWRRYLPWLALVVAVLLIAVLLLERAGLLPGADDIGASSQHIAAPAAKPDKQPAAGTTTAVVVKTTPAPTATRQNVSAEVNAPTPAPRQVSAGALVDVKSAEEVAAEAAVADLYRARDKARQEQPQVQREVAAATRPKSAGSRATQQDTDVESRVQEQAVDLEQMLEQARAETKSGEFVEHPAPFIGSLSQQTRNPIPTILYQRHDYSGQAARASVVMNGKTLRVGGSPAAGVKIDEILPNSAVLSYRGTQFRLRALNSWVNL